MNEKNMKLERPLLSLREKDGNGEMIYYPTLFHFGRVRVQVQNLGFEENLDFQKKENCCLFSYIKAQMF